MTVRGEKKKVDSNGLVKVILSKGWERSRRDRGGDKKGKIEKKKNWE